MNYYKLVPGLCVLGMIATCGFGFWTQVEQNKSLEATKASLEAYNNSMKATQIFESDVPICGTVLEETYAINSSEIDSKYTLKIRTDDGRRTLGVSILDGHDTRKESLDAILDPGMRVCFPRGNLTPEGYVDEFETYFNDNSLIGSKRVDRITIMDYQ
jgi:hypothetical protein